VIDCRGPAVRGEVRDGAARRRGRIARAGARERARRLLMIPYLDILSDIQEAMKKNSGITATRPGWPRNSRGSFLSRVVTT
jgi:hypothetical protein